MSVRPARRPARAMTLLEVVIAIGLIAFLLGSLLTFFWQTLEIRKVAGASAARTRLVKQVLDRISGELQAAVAPDGFQVAGLQTFTGDRRSITFLSHPMPDDESYRIYRAGELPAAPHGDLREVTYRLWIDPDNKTDDGDPIVGGIVRSEQPAITPAVAIEQLSEDEAARYIRHDLWSYEIGYLEFRYFDGVSWSTTWHVTQGNPLPHLVQITIGFDSIKQADLDDQDLNEYPIDQFPLGPDKPQPNRYTTIVRVAGADPKFSAHWSRMNDQVEEVYETPGQPNAQGGAPGAPTGGTPGAGQPGGKPGAGQPGGSKVGGGGQSPGKTGGGGQSPGKTGGGQSGGKSGGASPSPGKTGGNAPTPGNAGGSQSGGDKKGGK